MQDQDVTSPPYMAFDIHFPEQLRGPQLDAYLARGWYRIGQAVFTTSTIDVADRAEKDTGATEYRVFWLRYRLQDFRFGKKQQKLLVANRGFRVEFGKLQLTADLERLYTSYKSSLDFSIAPTLYKSLYHLEFYELPDMGVYDSQLIRVTNLGRLIAAGIFDQGYKAIAGIINLYEPGYRRYSLGKFLMLQKLQYAIGEGMDYYYPGYISPDFTKFDYKLWPGPPYAEVLNPLTEKWEPYSHDLMEILRREVQI